MAVTRAQIDRLLQAAEAARVHAYARYSGFTVGAAVLADNGSIHSGCNVENASYGLTVCAERVAIFRAVSEGAAKILAVAVVASGASPAMPCGACLQVISEFGGPDALIISASADGPEEREVHLLEALLPKPFRLTTDY